MKSQTRKLANGKVIRATHDQLAMMVCLSRHVPQPAALIAVDTGHDEQTVKQHLQAAKRNGWPVKGSSNMGYLLELEPIKQSHATMSEMLWTWADANL